VRNAALLEILERRTPDAVIEDLWREPVRLSAYVGIEPLPDELLISIRVLVLVGDDIVVVTNRNGGSHVWPGGRREPGETHAETACREILEETGWILDPTSLETLGFLHLENLGQPIAPFPYPDVLQLVTVGRAHDRAAEEWTDTEGWEIASRLVPLADVDDAEIDPLCLPFVEIVRARA
jgi:8-oxo-dGTP pyrophosphatase MutT (NUDIX family)